MPLEAVTDAASTPDPPVEGPNDDALMAAVAGGDHEAFSELYDRHAPNVFGLALRVLKRRADAEALVSDVFVEVWRKPDRFEPSRGTFRTYLLTLTRCRAIDRLRAAATRVDKTAAAGAESAGQRRDKQDSQSPQRIALADESMQLVREAVRQLDENQREPLQLAYFEGLTHQEIATRLDAPLGTVKTRIRTGLRSLRSALSKLGGQDELH